MFTEMLCIKIFLIVVVLFPYISKCSECEICDLKIQLERTKHELEECKLSKESFFDRACSRLGFGVVSKEEIYPLKPLVKTLIKDLNSMTDSHDSKIDKVERDLVLRISINELRMLQKFVLDNDNSVDVAGILTKSIKPRNDSITKAAELFNHILRDTGNHFKANFVILCQFVVVICGVALPLVCSSNKWNVIPKITLFLCLYAVLTTWIKQYYTVAAKKQAVLSKFAKVPTSCLLEKQGWFSAAKSLFTSLIRDTDDPCEDYYTAAMVDPAFEVSLFGAVIETFSVFIVLPAQTFGTAFGCYYSNLLEPLPWLWKVPVLVTATMFILFIFLVAYGYEFRIPFLLRIGPAAITSSTTDSKASCIYSEQPKDRGLPYPIDKTRIDELVYEAS